MGAGHPQGHIYQKQGDCIPSCALHSVISPVWEPGLCCSAPCRLVTVLSPWNILNKVAPKHYTLGVFQGFHNGGDAWDSIWFVESVLCWEMSLTQWLRTQALGVKSFFPGASDGRDSACKARDLGSIPGLGRTQASGITSQGHHLLALWCGYVSVFSSLFYKREVIITIY